MSKLKSTRLAREVNDACLQYWGGMGFMDETPVSRAYRDQRLGSIGGGSDEVMLGIISAVVIYPVAFTNFSNCELVTSVSSIQKELTFTS